MYVYQIKNKSKQKNKSFFLAHSAGIEEDRTVVSHLHDNEKDLKPMSIFSYVHKMSEKSNTTNLSFQIWQTQNRQKTEVSSLSANKKELKPLSLTNYVHQIKNK